MHAQGLGTYHAGNLGIWNASPRCPLEVSSYANVYVTTYGYAALHGGGAYYGAYAYLPYSIWAEARVAGSEFNAFSDRRIKNVVGPSDTKKDLELIRQLKVTDYRPKDSIADGNGMRKGFIAQEVEELIPEAVTKATNVVPNIYAPAKEIKLDAGKQQLFVTMTNAHGLNAGDIVRFYTEAGKFEAPVAKVIETNKFMIADWTNSVSKVFVFGSQVKDFRSLNYDRIFTTGVGAIQELASRLDEKSAQVNALERKLSELQKTVEKLAALQEKTRAALEKAEKVSVAAK
jgi:hypothetical protein